jgi:hypothetical protein
MFWGNKGAVVGEVAETATEPKENAAKSPAGKTVDLSVIDFGTPEPAGNVMMGFCAQGSPDEIQACVWKVDTTANAKGTAAENTRIHIEF